MGSDYVGGGGRKEEFVVGDADARSKEIAQSLFGRKGHFQRLDISHLMGEAAG